MGPGAHRASTDADLLDAWRDGDSTAGQELFARHYEAIERMLHNKVEPSCAVDLIQDVFVACVEGRERIRDGTRFRAYLLRIGYLRLCDYLRHRYRSGIALDVTDLPVQEMDPSPSNRLAYAREQRLLLEALRGIQLRYQIVLELHYWEELSTREIAAILDIPVGTVRSRLIRARDALEAEMSRVARSPGLLESTLTRLDEWARSCSRAYRQARAGSKHAL